MREKIELNIPVNRVEGDLDLHLSIEGGVVTEAKSKGTLYRGFENILKGRDALDSLVITPRVCGICSVSHLLAAAKAIENAFSITPPPQAVRLRNISVMAESMQSDMRQSFLMFFSDFTNKAYSEKSFFQEAKKLYEPFKGEVAKEVLTATSAILKVIATIGGQWPHTSHIVPGGISTIPSEYDLLNISSSIKTFKDWYEKRVLGCSIEEFEKIETLKDLEEFLEQNPDSEIARFTKISKELNLMNTGTTGYGFISYGGVDYPENPEEFYVKSGYFDGDNFLNFYQEKIKEDIGYSWFTGKSSLHPSRGETKPDMSRKDAYSWGKAPRYNNNPVQTGPLAEALISGDKLFLDLYKNFSDSTYVRQLARVLRPVKYIKFTSLMVDEIKENLDATLYIEPNEFTDGEGFGLTEAARGSLGHWVSIKEGKIDRYQIISPTTWNGSPKDKTKRSGAWEKGIEGIEIADIENPIEIGHVLRSFDPCLVCTVHFLGEGKKTTVSIGG